MIEGEGNLEAKLPTIWTNGKAKVGRVREEKRREEKRREEREEERRKKKEERRKKRRREEEKKKEERRKKRRKKKKEEKKRRRKKRRREEEKKRRREEEKKRRSEKIREDQRRSEKIRQDQTGSEKRKSRKKEDVGARKGRKVEKHYVFPMICKSRLAQAAGAEPSGQMRDEKVQAVVARSTFSSQKCKKLAVSEHFL